jgi:hypothetical protein
MLYGLKKGPIGPLFILQAFLVKMHMPVETYLKEGFRYVVKRE